MTYDDADRFAGVIVTLAGAMRQQIDTPTIELYFRGLFDIPFHLVEEASLRLAKGARFFPKIAEWRGEVDRILDEGQRRRELTAGAQPLLPGEVGEGRCPSCDDTGFIYFEAECDKEWRCRDFVEGTTHKHTWTKHCEECRPKREAKKAAAKRYSKPMWWERED